MNAMHIAAAKNDAKPLSVAGSLPKGLKGDIAVSNDTSEGDSSNAMDAQNEEGGGKNVSSPLEGSSGETEAEICEGDGVAGEVVPQETTAEGCGDDGNAGLEVVADVEEELTVGNGMSPRLEEEQGQDGEGIGAVLPEDICSDDGSDDGLSPEDVLAKLTLAGQNALGGGSTDSCDTSVPGTSSPSKELLPSCASSNVARSLFGAADQKCGTGIEEGKNLPGQGIRGESEQEVCIETEWQ